MQTLMISSVSEYIDVVCKANNELRNAGKKSDRLLFRGQADMNNELVPSLGRKSENGNVLISQERNMIEMARYKLPTVFSKELEPIELLALLQHHGIPTRLLDVSENALVGLYFACHNKSSVGNDGEVIVFKSNDMDVSNYPMVNSICATYKSRDKTQEELKELYECCANILFVYAPSYSLRQNIQRGRYILFPNRIEKSDEGIYKMTQNIDAISKDNNSVLLRIIVPEEHKIQIRRDLRLLGVSKELLFLDNADMVCKEITDRFSER